MESQVTLSQLIKLLFEFRLKPDGSQYNTHEVTQGTGIAFNTLKRIRSGGTPNPSVKTVLSLAKFFQIPPDYFASESETEARTMLASTEGQVTGSTEIDKIAQRIAILSPSGKEHILRTLDYVEGLERIKRPDDMVALCVDDDANNLLVLRATLDYHRVANVVADSGREAIELAHQAEFTVAFIDIMMPGVGGIEVAQRLKEINPNVVLVAVTAFAPTVKDRQQLTDAGFNIVITKPIDPTKFGRYLDTIKEMKTALATAS